MEPEVSELDVERYLARIGLDRAPSVDVEGLETLQRAHLTAVPFENLDVFAQRGVETSLGWSIPKIVQRGRGGWCFELNGAFSALLLALGFEVRRLGATVLLEPASPEASHLTLEVKLDSVYLVDVGFGDSFIRPLRFGVNEPQDAGSGQYLLVHHEAGDDDEWLLSQIEQGDPRPKYRFGLTEWTLADFDAASQRLQTGTSLHWTQSRFATRLLDGGPDRVTLFKDRIKIRRDGVTDERPVASSEWDDELQRWFDLVP